MVEACPSRALANLSEVYNFNGCGADDYFLLRMKNVTHHLGDLYFNSRGRHDAHVPQQVRRELLPAPGTAAAKPENLRLDERARLGGYARDSTHDYMRVRFLRKRDGGTGVVRQMHVNVTLAQLEHIYFDRYHAPVEKLFGDAGLPLQCMSVDHNACLVDCSAGNADAAERGCEFEALGHFLHVDVWEAPESHRLYWPRLG